MQLPPKCVPALAACLIGLAQVHALTLDAVVFGDSACESAHGLTAPMTQVTIRTADELRSIYQIGTGDCEVLAPVTALQNINGWTKSGVIIRQPRNANAAFVSLVVTAGNGLAFHYPTGTGDAVGTPPVSGVGAPQWVRMVRSGNLFTSTTVTNILPNP